MKAEIRHIANYIKQANSEQTAVDLISKYFEEQVTWSLEKEEWDKMSVDERNAFADSLTAPKSTPAKRVAAIAKIAKKKASKRAAKPVARPKEKAVTRSTITDKAKATKMSKAREIYKAMKNKPRQDILAAFIKLRWA